MWIVNMRVGKSEFFEKSEFLSKMWMFAPVWYILTYTCVKLSFPENSFCGSLEHCGSRSNLARLAKWPSQPFFYRFFRVEYPVTGWPSMIPSFLSTFEFSPVSNLKLVELTFRKHISHLTFDILQGKKSPWLLLKPICSIPRN